MPYLEESNSGFEYKGSAVRLDLFLHSRFQNISRERIKRAIWEKNILLNGDNLLKPSDLVKEGDKVVILKELFKERPIEPKDMDIPVIYQDKDLAIINKPPGISSHPLNDLETDTLVSGLLFKFDRLSDLNGSLKPGIVHRLDKDTSGIMIVAKNNASHQNIAGQFKDKSITKSYLALVEGSVEYDEGLIDRPIGRSRVKRSSMNIDDSKGKPAQTYFRVIKRVSLQQTVKTKKSYTFIMLFPKTGRTHQLRVHMKHYGHPVLGDLRYGERSDLISRQALHAYQIRFVHPGTNKRLSFKAPLLADFKNLLSKLKIEDYNLTLENIFKEV
jgi:23S rRNA pseudouridine1911/1915/1917 synthase